MDNSNSLRKKLTTIGTIEINIYPKTSYVTLTAFGDFFLGGEFENNNIKNEKKTFNEILRYIQNSHLNFCNFESTLSKRGKKRKNKGAHLYTNPNKIEILKKNNFNLVSLANNHINDFGSEGFEDTIKLFKDNNIDYLGAGLNKESAHRWIIKAINNIKIGFLAYTTSELWVASTIATKTKAGTNSLYLPRVKRDIKELKEQCNHIIVSLHWGHEYFHYPSPKQIRQARKIIDYGADIIIGHHAHVLQGVEFYKNKPIFYNLGNFFFPEFKRRNGKVHKWNSDSRNSILVQIDFNKNSIRKIQLLPIYQENNNRIRLITGKKKNEFYQNLNYWSEKLNTPNYSKFWNKKQNYPKFYIKYIYNKAHNFILNIRNSILNIEDKVV